VNVEAVVIGDELILGHTVDGNGPYIARALSEKGISVARRTIVGDDREAIAEAVDAALRRSGGVITSGGLGPTSDDVTRDAVAALFGRELEVDEAHLGWMRERWRRRFGSEMPEANVAQAMRPAGSTSLRNAHGSAPGIWIEDDRGWVAMLPGVPRELRGMVDDTLVPRLAGRATADTVVRSRTLRTTGIAESALADVVTSSRVEVAPLTLAYLPSPEGVDLRLTCVGHRAEAADELLTARMQALRTVVGDRCYGEQPQDLPGVVLELCRASGLTIAVAESCTGGMLGARLTAVAGSSDVFLGGVIAYADAVKREQLGVPAAVLAAHGAVSEEVARAMATAVRSRTGASIGAAITGIAGPGGGTPEKPVGTVWLGFDFAGEPEARLLHLWGDREEIRYRSTQAALDRIRLRLSGEGAAARGS
jgi:nicotinamide-nucleotide amidase